MAAAESPLRPGGRSERPFPYSPSRAALSTRAGNNNNRADLGSRQPAKNPQGRVSGAGLHWFQSFFAEAHYHARI
jgi:hypothetical protein